jgi:hypothetical protein
MTTAVGFHVYPSYIEEDSFYSGLLRIFIMKIHCDFKRDFSEEIEIFLHSVNVAYYTH